MRSVARARHATAGTYVEARRRSTGSLASTFSDRTELPGSAARRRRFFAWLLRTDLRLLLSVAEALDAMTGDRAGQAPSSCSSIHAVYSPPAKQIYKNTCGAATFLSAAVLQQHADRRDCLSVCPSPLDQNQY